MTSVAVPEIDQQTRDSVKPCCDWPNTVCAETAHWAVTIGCNWCDSVRVTLLCDDHMKALRHWLEGRNVHGLCGSIGEPVVTADPL